MVGTSLKIPGTKRIVKETINAVHHTPRGKAIWINLDPPPTKDYDIWIKGDCQRIADLYKEYERTTELEKLRKQEDVEKKKEERIRAGEERQEKRVKEQLRKEENQRERERRKEEKERAREDREQRKAEKEAEKIRRALEKAIQPLKKKKVKAPERKYSRPPTPLSFDTDSTLSSPSLSDIEFASIVESPPTLYTVPKTPSMNRIIQYLPTPDPTPQKGRKHTDGEQDSPLKNKKRKIMYTENKDFGEGKQRDSMSIRFLTGQG